ncbi:hypothetical protein ACLH09_14630 [Citrobacter braakii]|uniref:hypothetical protein n=1 Tax=Citrobacter TaxID=544 RepID=UPI002581E87B|nr:MULTISPECIES: hypothetical protein [Citrobacter]MDM3285471.1 hypothetical protein [Citrobacter sp. Cf042]MDN4261681.1 hypothetical protein [Citrobacter freundii]MEB0883995.1 hypothetical protein [Citrobacter freundii]HCB1586703.1 hypothetical protein [Citrobacter freundii]HEC5312782.1 hypothetical protein [Citrobacter freundii]
MTNTMSTVTALLNSFHDAWHMPVLQLVNDTHRERTPQVLLRAVSQAEKGIIALVHLLRVTELLVEYDGSTITQEEAWCVEKDLKELSYSFQWITQELMDLSLEIGNEVLTKPIA